MIEMRMDGRCALITGGSQGIGSNYQKQGLKLSKHFKPFDPAQR